MCQALHTSSTRVTVCKLSSVGFTRLWFCRAAGSGEVIVLRTADPLTEPGRFMALLENLERRSRSDVTIEWTPPVDAFKLSVRLRTVTSSCDIDSL